MELLAQQTGDGTQAARQQCRAGATHSHIVRAAVGFVVGAQHDSWGGQETCVHGGRRPGLKDTNS